MAPNLGEFAAGRPTARAAGAEVGALFSEHGRMVYGLCRMLLSDPEEAEDAMQQVFLSAHRGLLRGQGPRNAAAWLAAIARNECAQRGRAHANDPLPLAEGAATRSDPTQGLDQREEIEALCRAIAELPPQQRQAIVLREFYGLSYREVAAALALSDAAVQSLLFRSRRTLETRLRAVRRAFNALTVPLALQSSLAELVPGFSAGAAGAGAGAGTATLAKVAAFPGAAKLAAAVLAVGGVGTVAAIGTDEDQTRQVVSSVHRVNPLSELEPSRTDSASSAEEERSSPPPASKARRPNRNTVKRVQLASNVIRPAIAASDDDDDDDDKDEDEDEVDDEVEVEDKSDEEVEVEVEHDDEVESAIESEE